MENIFDTSSTLFVVPDVHGDVEALRDLLFAANLITPLGERLTDTVVVSIGDLVNSVASSQDADNATITAAKSWIDLFVVGNHEHPYFGGPKFSGFAFNPELCRYRGLKGLYPAPG